MSVELSHEALAEGHNFVIRLALRVEVGTALTTAHRKACKRVLEDLLETKELKDTKVNRRMKTETALVRSDCAVELNTVTAVNLDLTLIIYPSNSEHDLTLRLYDPLKNVLLLDVRTLVDDGLQRLKELMYCLVELRLRGILLDN